MRSSAQLTRLGCAQRCILDDNPGSVNAAAVDITDSVRDSENDDDVLEPLLGSTSSFQILDWEKLVPRLQAEAQVH
jgi:hypothetical protein